MKRLINALKTSLMARMVGGFFLLLILSVSTVSYLVYVQATATLTQSVFDRLHAVSILKEDGLNRWVDQQRLDLVFIAWQPEVRTQAGNLLGDSATPGDRALAHQYLADYLKFVVTSVSDSDELMVMDLNGYVILSTQEQHDGQLHAQDLFFIQGRSSTYVQPVYISPETGRPTITVSTPLFDQNKRRVGVLAGQLNLARVDRIIMERTGLGTSGETYLVNPTHEFVSAALLTSPDLKSGNVRSEGIDAAISHRDGAALYKNYQGIPVIGYYNWLDDRQVALMTEMSQDEAFAPARELAATTAEFGLASVLILVVVAYLLSQRIARPILAITATARKVATGDLTQMAPVMTGDEVGALAKTFNEMTSQLRQLYESLEKKVAERTADLMLVNHQLEEQIEIREKIEERLRRQNTFLEALHETSLGMISHLELNDLFEDLIRRAGLLMNTSHGYIFIHEPGDTEIECKVGVGLFSRLVGFRLKYGEGLGGSIWKSGKPLVIDDYDQWHGRASGLDRNLFKSIVGVPMRSGDQVIGVIGLAYDCQDCGDLSFTQHEIELLNRFAQLASIALINARLYNGAREARAIAEAANEAKSTFLANVSHELRTPLTSIMGFTRIVQKRFREHILPNVITVEDGRTQRAARQMSDNLEIILSEGARLTKLINDLLDLEKIQAGKMTWHMQPLQVAEVIELAGTATASLFESKGLTWVKEVPSGLPQVMGDSDRLEQVVINLISNAVKFSDAGSITCRAQLQGSQIVISVSDEGMGIAESDHSLVFEKFQQVGNSMTNKPKGTGLGLPISKEIVEYHGGRIWLESQVGKGSTFFFSLPLMASSLSGRTDSIAQAQESDHQAAGRD
jgi:signal transduction histidine kinase